MNLPSFSWTRHPKSFTVDENGVDIVTAPHTDLWQRTYYHFRNDNAPVFQMETAEPYFSFVVNRISSVLSHSFFQQSGFVIH